MNNYSAFLDAVGDRYYTIYSIDIETGKIELIRNSANSQLNIPSEKPEETIRYVIEQVAKEDYYELLYDFVDISKWSERLKNKNSEAIVYQDKNDRWRRAWIVPSSLGENGSVKSVVMCVRDITDEKQKEDVRKAEIQAARTDQLTGLCNRAVFYEIIKNMELNNVRNHAEFGIVFVDINGLKERNDAAGHEAGDCLILEVASKITDIFDREFVFRHGGDEFIIISFDRNSDEFDVKVEKLKAGWTDDVSAAVGGIWVTDVRNIDDYIMRADRRMYMDKNLFYQDKKNDRREVDKAYKYDQGLNYIPFEGLTFGDDRRFFYVQNMTTGVTRWSKNALKYFELGAEISEDAVKDWIKLVHPTDRAGVVEDLQKVFRGEKTVHMMDYRALTRTGQYITCTCKGQVISNPSGEGYLFVGSIENHEISEYYDSVTGLSNVFSFIKDTIQHLKYPGEDVLLAVGINDFSLINRKHGYEFGNKVLRKFSDVLRRIKVEASHAYRLDGTKFCIALKRSSIEEAHTIFKELKKLTRQGLAIDDSQVAFNISGGAILIDKTRDVDEQSVQAGIAYILEQSKHLKHSEFVAFNHFSGDKSKENLVLLDALRNSVYADMEGFYMCYQPVINAKSGKISGAEALLRWKKEPFGEVPPGIFIPLLESDPCFFELGTWILRRVLTDAKQMVDINPGFAINVNVSAEQIERTGFRAAVKEILEETGFPPKNLCMELTERVISLDIKYLKGELEFFKSLGIQIALDDFGTGISSMNLLLELPVDQIKIDRKFVKDIEANPVEQVIVESIAMCANKLNLDICVEGIESQEMKNFLMQYRITKHQGYYYSRPIVYNKILEMLMPQ